MAKKIDPSQIDKSMPAMGEELVIEGEEEEVEEGEEGEQEQAGGNIPAVFKAERPATAPKLTSTLPRTPSRSRVSKSKGTGRQRRRQQRAHSRNAAIMRNVA